MLLIAIVALFLAVCDTQAATLVVGPGRTLATPAAAMAAVQPGDRVEIDAATYTGATAVGTWRAANITIVGVGGRPIIDGATRFHAQGKACWLIQAPGVMLENIEITNCAVPDGNGAAVKTEAFPLTLRRVFFHHSQQGLLTINKTITTMTDQDTVTIEDSEFAHNGVGDTTGGLHNIYVGYIHRLTMTGSYSHDANGGQLVKSRARYNELRYNRLTADAEDSNYEVDFSWGGFNVLVGNIISQNSTSQNPVLITQNPEWRTHPEPVERRLNTLLMAYNTLVDLGRDGYGVFVLANPAGAAAPVLHAVENVFAGIRPERLITGSVLDTARNSVFASRSAAQLSFHYVPLAGSPVFGLGGDAGTMLGVPLTPTRQFLRPVGTEARWPQAGRWARGALEFMPPAHQLAAPVGLHYERIMHE